MKCTPRQRREDWERGQGLRRGKKKQGKGNRDRK